METVDFLKELNAKRNELLLMDAEVYDAQKELEKSEPFVALQARKAELQILRARVDGMAGGIKDRVETAFRLSVEPRDTKPYDGIQLKKFTTVTITDEQAAKEWVAENAPGCISIKKAPFNKVAKALGSLEFVDITTEYRAQIASDLSMYEEIEGVAVLIEVNEDDA